MLSDSAGSVLHGAAALVANLPDRIRIRRRIPNTQHFCFELESRDLTRLFLKIHISEQQAKSEYRALSVLGCWKAQLTGECSFSVPAVVMYGESFIISQFIAGRTCRRVLAERCSHTRILKQLARATAELHHALSRVAPLHRPSPARALVDWHERIDHLVREEGPWPHDHPAREIIRDANTFILSELQGLAADHWFARYKDANPANWIISREGGCLYAVDFDSERWVPFQVDLINILEYGWSYANAATRKAVVAEYARRRTELESTFSYSHEDDVSVVSWALIGLIRHQEQLLHRCRDLRSVSRWHRDLHVSARAYHFRKLRCHWRVVLTSDVIPAARQIRLLNAVDRLVRAYGTVH